MQVNAVKTEKRIVRVDMDLEKSNRMKKEQIITCDEEVTSGLPVFAGTRVPVAILINYLKAGDSLDRFLDGFPTVTRAQAVAFLDIVLDAALMEKPSARAA